MTRAIATREDADSIAEMVERVFDMWFASKPRVDWEEFLDRMESYYDIDMGENMDSPAIRRIKGMVRELRRLG